MQVLCWAPGNAALSHKNFTILRREVTLKHTDGKFDGSITEHNIFFSKFTVMGIFVV